MEKRRLQEVCSLPEPTGELKTFFARSHSDRTKGNGIKLKESRFVLKT